MAISVDGAYQAFIRHPLRVTQVDNKDYAGMVIVKKNQDKNAIFLQMSIKLSGIMDLIKKREPEAQVSWIRGLVHSSIDNSSLGNGEFKHTEWQWPESYAEHYILKYKVKPSEGFLKFIGWK